jgi:hypothetical protein
MKHLAAAALLVLSPLQERDADPDALAGDLSHPDIAVREEAARRLVALGDTAVPALRRLLEAPDPEARQRAEQALAQIDLEARLRRVCPVRPPLTLRLEGAPLEDALAEIARRTGVRFCADALAPGRRVSLSLERATLLEALDRICRALGDAQWAFDGPDRVSFSPIPFVERPTCYAGAFKVSMGRLDLYRTSTFRDHQGLVTFHLEAQAEPGARPLGAPAFTLDEVADDRGRVLTPEAPLSVTGPAVAAAPAGGADARAFTYGGLHPAARALARVRGAVTFFFALNSETVTLDNLARDSVRELGDFVVQINEVHSGSVQLTLLRKSGPFKAEHAIDPASIVVVDTEGIEYRPLPADLQRYSVFRNGGSFFIHFDRSWYRQAQALTFTLIRDVHERKIPFEFRDVALP